MNADEGGFEVALQFLVARFREVERRVGYPDVALGPSGAAFVRVRDDVDETADEAEVRLDARSDSHPSVERRRHQDRLVSRTLGGELFVVAVFFGFDCVNVSKNVCLFTIHGGTILLDNKVFNAARNSIYCANVKPL